MAAPQISRLEDAQYAFDALYAQMEELESAAADARARVGKVWVPGDYKLSGRATADAGWLLCDWGLHERADYPDLYAAIGDTHGAAAGTQFHAPNARGRVPAGVGQAFAPGAVAHALADYFGEATHILTETELPASGYKSTASAFQVNFGSFYNLTPNTGGGQEHENQQPTWIVNVFIKT